MAQADRFQGAVPGPVAFGATFGVAGDADGVDAGVGSGFVANGCTRLMRFWSSNWPFLSDSMLIRTLAGLNLKTSGSRTCSVTPSATQMSFKVRRAIS